MYLLNKYIRNIIIESLESEPIRKNFNIPIPEDLQDIHSRIKYAGRELFLVGGAVRDALMGKSPKDYDIATNASPEEVIKILQRDTKLRLDLTGKQFGVVRVKTSSDEEYEIATFREDIGKGKGTSVKFSTIENDVQRRDLTINALFYDMDSGEVVDYVGGLEDIKNGIIRAVGEPMQRFDEDRLRILRAVRFAGRMGSELDPVTKQAILEDNALIDTETGAVIPADRITEEFVKGIKSAQDVNDFLSLIDELNLFDQILPGMDIELGNSNTQDHIAQIAALLRSNTPNSVGSVLKKMRYSNDEIKIIKFLLQMLTLGRETAAEIKKIFNRQNINKEHLQNFADVIGMPASKVSGFLEFAAAAPASNPQDLMAQGLRGPEIGKAMASAETAAYGKFVNEVRKFVRQILKEEVLPLNEAKSIEPDMTKHVDDLEELIFTFLFTKSTFNELQTLEPNTEISTILPTNIFDDFENVNEVHIGVLVTDDNTGNIDAAYVCVPENRSASNLMLTLDIPRDYPSRDGFQKWLSEELADVLSHEIQHSCDSTEMLTSDDCGDESKKWESLENIEKYYGCDAEVRGHVAGILGRARRTGQDPEDLLDIDMNTVLQKSLSHGFTQEEVIPIIQNIYNKWLNRLETIR